MNVSSFPFLPLLFLSKGSLVAQMVKNPPAMWETWVPFLGWEDPPEKGAATYSCMLAWRTPSTVQAMGTDDQKQITDIDLVHANAAEEIQASYGNGNADPGGNGGLVLQKQAQNGYQHNVHGCDKACFACGSIHQSHLL